MATENKISKTIEMLRLAGLDEIADQVQSTLKESQDVGPLSITKHREVVKLTTDLSRLNDMRRDKEEELTRTWETYKTQLEEYEDLVTQIKAKWVTIDETISKLTEQER